MMNVDPPRPARQCMSAETSARRESPSDGLRRLSRAVRASLYHPLQDW
jgi:hypothetical protein